MISSDIAPIVSLAEAYRAAHESAVLVDRGALSVLRLTGKTRLDLINRMSTQAVDKLRSGQGAATVLTTDIGRIIDRIIVYAAEDHALLLAGEGHAEALTRYLRRNIFFNDDVQVRDITPETAIFGVYGPRAGETLASGTLPAADLPRHHWRSAGADGSTIQVLELPLAPSGALAPLQATIHRADPLAGDGYLVLTPAAQAAALMMLGFALPQIDEAAYDYLRIEAGQPRFGRELTLDYIPLEAGLWEDVSFSKGCYTGQEIIARMESRGKLAKRLVRLRPSAPVVAGAEIVAGGRPVGSITSAADGPAGPAALGYVKTSALDAGAGLSADGVALAVM